MNKRMIMDENRRERLQGLEIRIRDNRYSRCRYFRVLKGGGVSDPDTPLEGGRGLGRCGTNVNLFLLNVFLRLAA